MTDPTQEIEPIQRPASTAVMTTEQFDSTWRMSKALAQSGSFKDIGRAGPMTDEVLRVEASKALAKVLMGADLGMSPTQALMGIDIVKGNPQIRGVALGRMVRLSARRPTPSGESYDYKVIARDFTPDAESATVALYRRDEDGTWPIVENEEGESFDTVLGPVVIPKGQKLPWAVEAFKLDQAKKRKLIRTDGAWELQPEVMVVWRALSQLVRFEAPDVIGGMPVYTEADGLQRTPNLSEGQGSGEGPGWGEMPADLVERVGDLIRDAKITKFAPLADEAVIQQRLFGQSRERVEVFIAQAREQLDSLAVAEPVDADVVEDGPLTLTFGGETFEFADASEDPYEAIRAALSTGPEAMTKLAHTCERVADEMDNNPDESSLFEITRFRSVAVALVREAVGQTGGENA